MNVNRHGVRPAIVAMLLFGSGFCALVYQTVWLRELRNVFGASTASTAAVVGIFMLGLGAGGLRLGRTADRSKNPLNLYAMLELGVVVAAVATIALLPIVETIYWSTGGTLSLGLGGATTLRLLLAVLLLGPATFLMGGTLPAAARSIVTRDDVSRRSIAMLYGVNTLGAVVGALASTFFALEMFGNTRTLLLAVLLNGIVVVSARAHARAGEENEEDDAPSPAAATDSDDFVLPTTFVLSAAVVTGFVFMLMEMVWYRVLAPILGGSTFTFGLILAVALAGIGIGGLIYSMFEARRPATASLFSLTCALEAFAIAFAYMLGDRVAVFAVLLQPMEVYGFAGRIVSWVLLSSVVVLPAAIVAGFQFPLLIALAGRARKNVGRDVGRVYAFNTVGAILGSLGGGFGLMPALSAEGCWTFSVWIMAMLALAAALAGLRTRERAWSGVVVAAATLGLLAVSAGPTAVWRHSPIGAGRVKATFGNSAEFEDWKRLTRRSVVWEKEGVESAVAVVGHNGYAFLINGKSDGSAIGDAGTQVMGGLIGAIQHEKPTRSLVIGLGTGSTAGWLASVPGMERVDVAELEPAVVEVARFCAPVNENVLDKDNVEIFIGDAREILLASDSTWDLIFSEPSNPYRAGIASLFTREFYEASRDRLTENGIFMQWVQGYEVTPRTMETIFATLHEVFPYVQIWETLPRDYVLVGSTRPMPVRTDLIRERITKEPYARAAAAAWKVTSVEQFVAHYVADQRLIEQSIAPDFVDINTDDRNVVEFGFARSVGKSESPGGTTLRDTARQLGADALPDRELSSEAVRRFTVSSPLLTAAVADRFTPLDYSVDAYRRQDFNEALRVWDSAGLEAVTHAESLLLARSLAQIGDERCQAAATSLARYSPIESDLARAICESNRAGGDAEAAAGLFENALVALRSEPWVDVELVVSALVRIEGLASHVSGEARLGLVDAVGQRFAVSMADDLRARLALRLASTTEGDHCGERTIRALHDLEPHVPWQEVVLGLRAECYAAAGDPLADQAKQDSVKFQLRTVEPFGSKLHSSR